MSLLRRIGNNMSNQSNQNNPKTPPSNRPSPFSRGGSSTSSSSSSSSSSAPAPARFGSRTSGTNQNNPFGNWRNRVNNTDQRTLEWSVSPLTSAAVRFQLNGLGDPFHRLLGTDLNVELGNPLKVVEALQNDNALRTQLEAVLDEAWSHYGFRGAALMHPWEDDVRKALVHPPLPVEPPKKKDDSDDDEDDYSDDDEADGPFSFKENTPRQIECLRAIDVGLVLNVLARVRSQVLVEATPLALDPGFLDRTYVTDDPRLVAIARATGCIDEAW